MVWYGTSIFVATGLEKWFADHQKGLCERLPMVFRHSSLTQRNTVIGFDTFR